MTPSIIMKPPSARIWKIFECHHASFQVEILSFVFTLYIILWCYNNQLPPKFLFRIYFSHVLISHLSPISSRILNLLQEEKKLKPKQTTTDFNNSEVCWKSHHAAKKHVCEKKTSQKAHFHGFMEKQEGQDTRDIDTWNLLSVDQNATQLCKN